MGTRARMRGSGWKDEGDKDLCPFSKSKSTYMKSDSVNLITPASPVECLLFLTQCLCGAVQTGTGKVDPDRKFQMYYCCPWGVEGG